MSPTISSGLHAEIRADGAPLLRAGETNLRAVWPIYLTVALPAILALALAPSGLSPPLILRLGYTTSVAAFIARRVRNVDRLTRIRVGTADSTIPLLLMLS
jgi:hypothetical protein